MNARYLPTNVLNTLKDKGGRNGLKRGWRKSTDIKKQNRDNKKRALWLRQKGNLLWQGNRFESVTFPTPRDIIQSKVIAKDTTKSKPCLYKKLSCLEWRIDKRETWNRGLAWRCEG